MAKRIPPDDHSACILPDGTIKMLTHIHDGVIESRYTELTRAEWEALRTRILQRVGQVYSDHLAAIHMQDTQTDRRKQDGFDISTHAPR